MVLFSDRLAYFSSRGFNKVCFTISTIQVAVYLQNWSHVLSYVNKAESTPELTEVRQLQATFLCDYLCALIMDTKIRIFGEVWERLGFVG